VTNKKTILTISTFLFAALLISLIESNAFAIHKIGFVNYGIKKIMALPNFGFGPIASVNQDWVLAGQWSGFYNQTNLSDSGFHSIFRMVKADGTAPHSHEIYNATATNITQHGNATIIKGTASITLKDGPVNNVPITLTIINGNILTISMDPSKTNNHFGNTPIFGLVNNIGKDMKMMMQKPNTIGSSMIGQSNNNSSSSSNLQTMK
jgi:hypothetical protein